MPSHMITGMPTRYDGDPARVAVLFPGVWYVPARPLLHFAMAVLRKHGWTVQEVWWDPPAALGSATRASWVRAAAEPVLDAESAATVLVVGKSLGSFVAPVAAERGLPAVWVTPLLNDPTVVEGLERADRPALLVGGTADPSWDGETARRLGRPLVELPGADHTLETDDDPVNSAELLKRYTAELDRFVGTL